MAAALLSAAAPAVSEAAPSDWTAMNPVTPLTAASFAKPPATDQPWARINLPASGVTIEGLQRQLQDLAAAHVAGAEYGQGAVPTQDQFKAILTEANRLGIKVSLSHGPTQNPTGYSINGDNARKNLFFGAVTVNAGETFTGAVPPPAPASANTPTLVAVLAYRCDGTCAATGVQALDRASALELTSTVTGTNTAGVKGGTTAGNISWTAPAAGQWRLIAFWSRGVFAQPDPFSTAGTNELIASMETYFTPEIKDLMAVNGGDVMYDSHSSDRGSPDEVWTNDMASEFRTRAGYDLTPNFAGLFYKSFRFTDGSDRRVRNDLYRVRGDIWIEKHLKPLEAYLHTFNAKLRVQPEGERDTTLPINNMVQAAAALDRTEYESLWGDIVDMYVPMASAVHMLGNPWYSTECCAVLNKNYAETLQDAEIRMYRSFAGGITKQVYHVYPYADGPTSPWPGYHNFGQSGFAMAWGPRNPDWALDAPAHNDMIARNQQVLTQGQAKVDVAVYMENYLYPQFPNEPHIRFWPDTGLERAGYTHDYLDPTMLSLPNATVSHGRLAENGPAYKAFIVDAEQYPATDPVKTSMPVSVAQKLLGYAQAGLPVVIVGALPDRTPGNTPAADAQLRALIDQLLALPGVRRAAHESDVPGVLAALGVDPAAKPSSPSPVLSVHRDAGGTQYYWFHNQGDLEPAGEPQNLFEPAAGAPVERGFVLEGRGRPYLLDAQTGAITPIASYTSDGDHVSVRVRLAQEDSAIVALSDDPSRFGVASPAVHATGSDADVLAADAHTLAIRATKGGTYTTSLSDGRTATTTIGDVPAAIDLTGATWQLDVSDWQPKNPYATTVGPLATETLKVPRSVSLSGLKSWPAIPELQDVSGDGTYRTTVSLPAGIGATISLGEVFDSFTLSVNGHDVPISQRSAQADVGPFLKAGANEIVVRVATTLNNRLRTLDPGVGARPRQAYGLIGPVVLTPYRQAVVYASTDAPGTVGGSVPATLSLSLGGAASFGAFTPGVDRIYTASTTASVTSTAGDAALSASAAKLANGAFRLAEPVVVTPAKAVWTGPVSNDAFAIAFSQHIGANEPLRTGAYTATVTFTLSTTTP